MSDIYADICKKLEGAVLLSEEKGENLYIDTGSYALNRVMSGKYSGGLPVGIIWEIYGESSSAKTVFLTHAFVGAQKKGYYTVLVDNEHAYHPEFAESLGIDSDKLIYSEPTTIEDCFEFIENVILAIRETDKDTPILIGFDSIGTPPSNKEMEGEIGGDNMSGAIRAKQTGVCLRRVNSLLKKHKASLVIINQIRNKVGVLYGDPTTKAGGGKSLAYYCGASVLTKSGSNDKMYDDLKNPLGIKGRIVNKKNKHAIPSQECDFELYYDRGLTRDFGLVELAIKDRIIEMPTKGWYSFIGEDKKIRKADMNAALAERIKNGEIE